MLRDATKPRILSPSILAADFLRLGEEINSIERGGASYLHFDVMDGHFVSNISFGLPVLASIRPSTPLTFDVHLMISQPARYVDAFAQAGADIITVHAELGAAEVLACLKKTCALGKKASLAVNPGTPFEAALPFAEQAGMVLFMSVEPGLGGQELNPDVLRKASNFADYAASHGLNVDIEMDGGINLSNLSSVLSAGVNVMVAGSAVFAPGKTEANARAFTRVLTR